jgi:hypothetical protein
MHSTDAASTVEISVESASLDEYDEYEHSS